jgi:uncharacterized protein with HEPN domain
MTEEEIDLRAHLESFLTLFENAKSISTRVDRTSFFGDRLFQLAIFGLIGQFGEVSRRMLTKFPDFCSENPSLPFVLAKGMRNRIVHDYESVDLKAVWRTFDESIPQFEKALIPIIQAFDAKHGTP